MLGKISVVKTSAQIAYLKTEYLSAGADKTEFLGEGAKALGLTTQTDAAVLALCEGKNPTSGKQLVASGRDGTRRAGWEFALSPDKTISLAMGFGDDATQEAIRAAHSKAVERAIAYAEGLVDVRRTSDGERYRAPAKAIFARYTHLPSREGDPQLHDHIFLLNLGIGPDGKPSAIATERLMASKEVIGQIYQTALYEELSIRGIATEKRETPPSTTGEKPFTAAVIPALDSYAADYSTRRIQIISELEKNGASGTAAAQKAALKTRKKKSEPELKELLAQWRESAPITTEQTKAAIYGNLQPTKVKAPTVNNLVLSLIKETAKTQTILTDGDIAKHIAKSLAIHTDTSGIISAIEEAKKHPDLVYGGPGRDGQGRYVSTTVLAMEADMMTKMDHMAKQSLPVSQQAFTASLVASKGRGLVLTDEQRLAAQFALGSGKIVCLEGFAGAGKTTSLRVVAETYSRDGFEVIGCSKAALAATKLGEDAAIKSQTIDSLNRDLDNGKKRLTTKSVVIVDEAGMLDTSPAARLVAHAHQAGAKIIFVGDRKQLQPIGQGGVFIHAATIGDGAFILKDNRRQVDETHKAEALIFRNGTSEQIQGVFDQWIADGRMILKPTVAETAKAAAGDYFNDSAEFKNKVLLAETRAVVSILNGEVQKHRLDAGEISEAITMQLAPSAGNNGAEEVPLYENVSLAIGDRIRFCKNSTKQHGILDPSTGKISSVENGNIGVIEAMTRDGEAWIISASLDSGKKVSFRTDRYDRIDLGYASTVHKSQGQSVEACYDVSLNPSRHSQYVAQTRHKARSRTYTTGEACEALASRSTREDYAQLASVIVAEARKAQITAVETAQKAAEATKDLAKGASVTQGQKTAPAAPQVPARTRKQKQEQGFGLGM